MPSGTLILTRQQVAQLLELDDCIAAVENTFRAMGEGRALRAGVLAHHAHAGAFHIKAGGLDLGRPYFAAKVNGNFPANHTHGLPTIQGVIVFADGETGTPLALLDSMEITTLRTGAATAVAARYLARSDPAVVTVCGCGIQGRIQLRALSRVRPIARVYAHDQLPAAAATFAEEMTTVLGVPVSAIADLASAAPETTVWITCTTARRPFLTRQHVAPGAFVAAVGADNPEKSELEPELLAAHPVIADVLEQCATIGDLHHAIAAGRMRMQDVRAELGDVVAGTKPGRIADHETIIFDSTGTALQDVAAAALVYERALQRGGYLTVELGA